MAAVALYKIAGERVAESMGKKKQIESIDVSSDGVTKRLLDALAAGAQPCTVAERHFAYRWGQHLWTDEGDNIAQYGLHGSAQAVMGFAAGVRNHGDATHYRHYLNFGLAYLSTLLDHPKKPLDLRKSLKLSELIAALGDAGASETLLRRGTQLLLESRVGDRDGWDFDLHGAHRKLPRVLPTLYVMRAILSGRLPPEDITVLNHGLEFCAGGISAEGDEKKRHAELYWLVHLDALHRRRLGKASPVHGMIAEQVAKDKFPIYPLLEAVTFEYQIADDAAQAQHAFCDVPLGLYQFATELWCRTNGVSLPDLDSRLWRHCSELVASTFSGARPALANIETCSFGARLTLEWRQEVQALLEGTAVRFSPPPPPARSPRAKEEPTEPVSYREFVKSHLGPLVALLTFLLALGTAIGTIALFVGRGELAAEQDRSLGFEQKSRFLDVYARYHDAVASSDPSRVAQARTALQEEIRDGVQRYRKSREGHARSVEGFQFTQGSPTHPPTVTFPDRSIWELPRDLVLPAPPTTKP
jgi:hypothetical protein